MLFEIICYHFNTQNPLFIFCLSIIGFASSNKAKVTPPVPGKTGAYYL
jgi:hypothetical protein